MHMAGHVSAALADSRESRSVPLATDHSEQERAMRHYTGRLALAMALTLVGYLLIYRALQLRWGATHDQVTRAMPGDDIQRQPVFTANRAITISARPEEIWPWLMQMGYRCGGWYGYRPDRQRRHFQHREGSPGVAASEGGRHRADMAEPGFPGGGALEANRYLVFATRINTTAWRWGGTLSTEAICGWFGASTRVHTTGVHTTRCRR
jgi:hypothetical protein